MSLTHAGCGRRLDEAMGEPSRRDRRAALHERLLWSRDDEATGEILRALGGAGIATLRFDFTALGDSEGDFADKTLSRKVEDLLATVLAACTSMTLRLYADRKGWSLEAVRVDVGQCKAHVEDCATCERPSARIDVFERRVELVGPLDETQRQRLREIADRCPVHRTLTSETRLRTTLMETPAGIEPAPGSPVQPPEVASPL